MRIVSLLSSATEILFAIGAGDEVAAVSHECDYPPAATKLPRATRSRIDSSLPSGQIDEQVKQLLAAGESLYEIDRELICQLRPGLIVTQAQCDVCAVRYQDVVDLVAEEAGLADTAVVALQPQSFADVLGDIQRIGQAAGAERGAIALNRSLLKRWNGVLARICSSPDAYRPQVAVLEWTEPLMAAGNWTPELIHAAGGASLFATAGEPSGYLTWLDLVGARPDVLIVAPCGFNLERSLVEARRLMQLPGWRDLPAVAQGRAFVVDGNAYLNRSGPRLVDSLEILAHLIRPELFEAPGRELAEGRAWATVGQASRLP
jgi:iron complex transport system substrate-binding protein